MRRGSHTICPAEFIFEKINDEEKHTQIKKINQYYLIEKLSSTANSKVFASYDSFQEKTVAVKVIKYNTRIRQRPRQVLREIRNMRQMKHPNLLELLDVLHSRPRQCVYLVLEYCSFGSLSYYINKKVDFSEAQIRSIFHQVLKALHFLHVNGFLHNDLKPSNILISETGEVKISDFGVSKNFLSQECFFGTPAYTAPEFLSEDETSDSFKEDVWSLGISLYESCFKKRPWGGSNIYEINQSISEKPLIIPDCSDELKDLIKKMLSIEPLQRPTTEDLLNHPFFQHEKEPPLKLMKAQKTFPIKNFENVFEIEATKCNNDELFNEFPLSESYCGNINHFQSSFLSCCANFTQISGSFPELYP